MAVNFSIESKGCFQLFTEKNYLYYLQKKYIFSFWKTTIYHKCIHNTKETVVGLTQKPEELNNSPLNNFVLILFI